VVAAVLSDQSRLVTDDAAVKVRLGLVQVSTPDPGDTFSVGRLLSWPMLILANAVQPLAPVTSTE